MQDKDNSDSDSDFESVHVHYNMKPTSPQIIVLTLPVMTWLEHQY